LLAGLALGAMYFGGLWLTVRALPKSRRPAALTLVSFWARTALVAAGFALLIGQRWQYAFGCVLGFLMARLFLTRWHPPGSGAGPNSG
jgi:F1F0 ATPase subunit 2